MNRMFRSAPARFASIAFSLFLAISQLTRVALVIASRHQLDWGANLAKALLWGLAFDIAAACFALVPWVVVGALLPRRWSESRVGRGVIAGAMALFIGILLFIATGEWFFWDEFGARFNFIAVDYLIWTQEVWGNIRESYPMVPILSVLALTSAAVTWGLERTGCLRRAAAAGGSRVVRGGWLSAGIFLPALLVWLPGESLVPPFANSYNGEIARNGCWAFCTAFRHMELRYDKWYTTLPHDEAMAHARELLVSQHEPAFSDAPDDLRREIGNSGAEHRWNVILVCMESMSGDYLSCFGNAEHLTPNLDRLAGESWFFDNLYATGTRTVRGMEALTLGLPPIPGQSVLYRPDGHSLATSFLPFVERNYDCAFLYGGDGRFDFMNRYFSTAGCRIVDAGAWEKQDTTFKTSWGACDEDLFRKTITEADAASAAGRQFHYFCMTTSNHRPYDFPAGRIDLPSHSGRGPAVKYADWAVGNFLETAASRPWFRDTLFVFVADHCASSAGRTELDVTRHHIPALIYNPTLVPARRCKSLCSQIDLMPTVFGLLGWNHRTLGYGHNLLASTPAGSRGRAFVSNYQKLGLLEEDCLAILKPNRQVEAFACDRSDGSLEPLQDRRAASLLRDATTFYQSASFLFDSGRLKLDAMHSESPSSRVYHP